MKKYLKQHWFELVSALLFIAVVMIGVSVIFGYCFSTNDDAMLRNIVSGNYTGTPDAHLVYVMYPLSFIWKCLYSMVPSVAWYDLFMVGAHYLCWFMLLFRLGQQFKGKLAKTVALVLGLGALVIVDLPYLVMHQYTVLAAWLAVVAVFWLATGSKKSGKEYWADRIICILFLTLCLWLRKQVFFMALPIGFFILVWEFVSAKKEEYKSFWEKTAIFLSSIAIIVAISFVVEKTAYSSAEWKDFQVYNEARTDIYDFYGVPAYQTHEAQYEQLDIGYGDWLVIDHYDGGLMQGLDSETLVGVAKLSKQNWLDIQKTYNVFLQNLYSVCQVMLHNDIQPVGLILTVLYVLALFACFKKDDKGLALTVCGMLLFQGLFVGYFIWQQRYPEHVSYGLYLMQLIFLSAVLIKQREECRADKKDKCFWIGFAFLICCIVMGMMGIYRIRTTMTEYNESVARANDWYYMNEYFSQNPENRYCIITKSFVFSTEEMFAEASVESGNVIRLGTWVQNSPLEKEHNANISVSDIAMQMLQEDGFYIVQFAENDVEWITAFFENAGCDVVVEVEDVVQTPGGRMFHLIGVK